MLQLLSVSGTPLSFREDLSPPDLLGEETQLFMGSSCPFLLLEWQLGEWAGPSGFGSIPTQHLGAAVTHPSRHRCQVQKCFGSGFRRHEGTGQVGGQVDGWTDRRGPALLTLCLHQA